jgi:glycosyltransferase involved in cell wall biosynthesis
MSISTLSIIIPVYNEAETIHLILDRIREVNLVQGIKKQLILVNDASTDHSREAIAQYQTAHPDLDMAYYEHDKNLGKGASLRTGFAHAKGEYTIIQDADLEYDPQEYNDMLKPVVRGVADVVFGSRFMGNNPHRILFFWHTIGNKFITTISNMFTNLNLTDIETCYKLFNTELLRSLNLRENRFGIEPELTAKVARIPKVRIYEIGISYYGRTYDDGKKVGWRDGVEAIYCILKYGLFKAK